MKIEKGKLYYDARINKVFKANIDKDNEGDFIQDKIAVHCPDKEDFEYIRSVLGNVNHNRPFVFINEKYGLYRDYKDYHTITIDQFREFYPEEDKELEVGKWYKYPDISNWMVCVNEFNKSFIRGYGFNSKSVWMSEGKWMFFEDKLHLLVEATTQEVESALIEEAKRRYKVGDKLNKVREDHADDNRFFESHSFTLENNCLYFNSTKSSYYSYCIFNNGQWAEVVDKFAELKEAHKNGAVIQWRREIDGKLVWEDCHENDPPTWNDINEYRIKPEEEIPAFDCGSRIDLVDFIVSNKFDFLEGCVIALVSRHKENDGIDDLKAAQYYLQKLIDRYES